MDSTFDGDFGFKFLCYSAICSSTFPNLCKYIFTSNTIVSWLDCFPDLWTFIKQQIIWNTSKRNTNCQITTPKIKLQSFEILIRKIHHPKPQSQQDRHQSIKHRCQTFLTFKNKLQAFVARCIDRFNSFSIILYSQPKDIIWIPSSN